MLKKIIITSDKAEEMSEMVEKMLHYGGKLMSCLEDLSEDELDERRPMGMREDRDEDEFETGMRGGYGQRRGRSSGRYSRY